MRLFKLESPELTGVDLDIDALVLKQHHVLTELWTGLVSDL